ncbi:unnamed protein product [Linum tenue]|uniref:Kinetochore protein Nuf2 N-terminal domain-containing protein n=1 Tax=Linum tenue TaxID=586396 RepID=A0AAV0GR07_9ROSI|nr:unnamed protein product [Linum tenue]
MSSFDCPQLTREEILDVLTTAGIAATDSDLKKPTAGFVYSLYSDLLAVLGVPDAEDPGQVEFDDLEQLEYPPDRLDRDEKWFQFMSVYNMTREVLGRIRCPLQFTLYDLVKPENKRTEFLIGSIANFYLHKDSKMEMVKGIIEDTTCLVERLNELETEKSKLDAEIAECNAAREIESPVVQELEAKLEELHQTIASLNSQQNSLRATLSNLKEKAGEMDMEISKSEFDMIQSREENANLHSMIVQSPDKLQKAIEEKRSIREETRNAERLAMQAFQEKTLVLEVYSKTSKKLSKHYSQMQAIHEQMNSAKSIEKELKALQAKLSDDGVTDKSLAAKMMERRGKVQAKSVSNPFSAQQLAKLRKQLEKERKMKFEDADKELHSKKLEVESRKRDLEERQMKVEAVLGEADAINSKINLSYETGAAKVRALDQKCNELVEQFERYQSSIGDVLKGYGGKPAY